jgi:hypothetical protein
MPKAAHAAHLHAGPAHTLIVGSSTVLIVLALLFGTWAYVKSKDQ